MQFKIHKQGWIYLATSLILSIILFPFFLILSFLFLFISLYIFYFFRDPDRYIPYEDLIVSPADGIVTHIGEEHFIVNESQKNTFIKVSIFLDIFNVHVNRMPCNGIIKNIKYIHGKFINATLDKSSNDNERNIITLEKENNDIIIIKQIAGLIARRIVCEVKTNQQVYKGHRFGIIKFGSRVDLLLPMNYKPLVTLGQTVVGGETIIANPNKIEKITKSLKI
tara:strand:- start:195 stop:863 length:669 start_codon:yes stop_codon:yes gene_type:complete